ncbi:MAG: hypothetical protein HC829_06740 [Bacteroidales bacterium]|nr:hypothetical protein [Bacteroidales bacterium]
MSLFDSLGFAQELKKVNVPGDQAETLAALIRDHVVGNTVKKENLADTENRLNEKIDRVEERITSELRQVEQRMTIKLGAMMAAAVAIIVAAQKLV